MVSVAGQGILRLDRFLRGRQRFQHGWLVLDYKKLEQVQVESKDVQQYQANNGSNLKLEDVPFNDSKFTVLINVSTEYR